MISENKDDPLLWINRAKKDYFDVKSSLCVTGSAPEGRLVTEISKVSMIKKGILVTLHRYAFQGGEHLLIPVSRCDTAEWNVPLNAIFDEAIANTAALFPPKIYDLETSGYIDYSEKHSAAYDFENTRSVSAAAESRGIYDAVSAGQSSGLRLIVTTSPLVGDTPILYPDMLLTIGRVLRTDPAILICEPGKLFVFDGVKRKAIERYAARYRERFGKDSPEPRIYKYLRKNKLLLDNSPEKEAPDTEPPKETNIPRGCIASAWGDPETRNKLLDWKRSCGGKKDAFR